MTTEERLAIAVQGLRDVVSPVQKIRRECPPGSVLDGLMVNQILDQPYTYQELAMNTLHAIGEPVVPREGE